MSLRPSLFNVPPFVQRSWRQRYRRFSEGYNKGNISSSGVSLYMPIHSDVMAIYVMRLPIALMIFAKSVFTNRLNIWIDENMGEWAKWDGSPAQVILGQKTHYIFKCWPDNFKHAKHLTVNVYCLLHTYTRYAYIYHCFVDLSQLWRTVLNRSPWLKATPVEASATTESDPIRCSCEYLKNQMRDLCLLPWWWKFLSVV